MNLNKTRFVCVNCTPWTIGCSFVLSLCKTLTLSFQYKPAFESNDSFEILIIICVITFGYKVSILKEDNEWVNVQNVSPVSPRQKFEVHIRYTTICCYYVINITYIKCIIVFKTFRLLTFAFNHFFILIQKC